MAKPEETKQPEQAHHFTDTQLKAYIAAAVEAALGERAPAARTNDELAAEHSARTQPRGEPPEFVPIISRTELYGTGAAMLAIVVRGRMVSYDHYRHPWERLKGGKTLEEYLPAESISMKRDPNGRLPPRSRQYIYETFVKADIARLNGKKLNPALRMTAAEIEEWGIPLEPTAGTSGIGSAPIKETTEAA